MKIIVLGTLVPAEYENRIRDLSNAGNRFLMNFTRQLAKSNEVEVYSYLGIDVDGEVFNDLKKNQVADGAKLGIKIEYFYKSKYKLKGVLKYKSKVKASLETADLVITYNATYAWMFASRLAKQLGKKSLLILADYSPVESYSSPIMKKYAALELRAIKGYDYVVGLSEGSKAMLEENQKFICIEGGIDRAVYDYFKKEEVDINTPSQKTLEKLQPISLEDIEENEKASGATKFEEGTVKYMYAGVLEPVTGIDMLLEAFSKNKAENLRLYISGKGTLSNMVEEYSKRDFRIIYLGCPPYGEYLDNLSKADVLVNPRNMSLPENANNFPSKIMEYLATGKSIISTRFPGFNKFEEYIFFCDSSVDALQEAIEKKSCDISTETINEIYIKNREFAEEFLWENQVDKIVSAISGRSFFG